MAGQADEAFAGYQASGLVPQDEGAARSSRALLPKRAVMAVAAFGVVALASVVLSRQGAAVEQHSSELSKQHASKTGSDQEEQFDDKGRFIFREYDMQKPFSSFLPGVGGEWGTPLYAFYNNRGQSMVSVGSVNKDGAMMEFLPASKAYQEVPWVGFRTFIKGTRKGKTWVHQPFFPEPTEELVEQEGGRKMRRNMHIGMNELEIREENDDLDLDVSVQYYQVPNEDFGALIRRTTLTNTHDSETLEIEALDGMARVLPYGLQDLPYKLMARTFEAWMEVHNVDGEKKKAPFFRLSQGTADTEEVQVITQGNWAISFLETEGDEGQEELLDFIVDPAVVFGGVDTAIEAPTAFILSPLKKLLEQLQVIRGRTPCAYAAANVTLKPGQSVTITSAYGQTRDVETFNNVIIPAITARSFVQKKLIEAEELTERLTKGVKMVSGSPLFDGFVKQSYLDNLLRGGVPSIMGDAEDPKVLNIFSRKHGDLERDYNDFVIESTYFSQGPGNFRDVAQNRRSDVVYEPRVGDFDVRLFLSLTQADAYNPLIVGTSKFALPSEDVASELALAATDAHSAANLTALLSKPFLPGDLFRSMDVEEIYLTVPKPEFLRSIATAASQVADASFAQNGYWADHWTYTLDLVENYLMVYPENKEYLMFDSEPVPFFQSPGQVNPRDDKYVETKRGVRQYTCVANDEEKVKLLHSRKKEVGANWQRAVGGEVFAVPVITKLVSLAVIKFSTLDPLGMGVEMDGGKPGWNDAMNGLPGLLGSGTPETFELLRLLRFLRVVLKEFPERSIPIYTELHDLIEAVRGELKTYNDNGGGEDDAGAFNANEGLWTVKEDDQQYWDNVRSSLEEYREAVRLHFSGGSIEHTASDLDDFVAKMEAKMESGVERAIEATAGETPCFFWYETTEYHPVNNGTDDYFGRPHVVVDRTMAHTVPLFLEGPTRRMKVLKTKEEKKALYEQVLASTLYDDELKMYKISESLQGQPEELGRMLAFPPGWLENESIWMHMSFKWYVEILRAGLFSEFWEEAKTGMPPFMEPGVYGRSPLEMASFIVSSAFPDPDMWGSSYLARLSGSTAELFSVLNLATAGPEPFTSTNGELSLEFMPALPDWMFTSEGQVSFTFMGGVNVTYHNPRGLDTWDEDFGEVSKMSVRLAGDGTIAGGDAGEDGGLGVITCPLDDLDPDQDVVVEFESGVLPPPYAEMVRAQAVRTIDVHYK